MREDPSDLRAYPADAAWRPETSGREARSTPASLVDEYRLQIARQNFIEADVGAFDRDGKGLRRQGDGQALRPGEARCDPER